MTVPVHVDQCRILLILNRWYHKVVLVIEQQCTVNFKVGQKRVKFLDFDDSKAKVCFPIRKDWETRKPLVRI